MVSLILSFAALGLASSRPPVINGFPSGNSSAAPSARDYNLSSIDIRQAYLQSLLDPNVPLYMCPPPDVFPFDQHGSPLVCRRLRLAAISVWSQAGWSRVGRPLLLLPHHVGHDAIHHQPLSLCLPSSAEAEYFGAMMAARDLIFVRDLLIELAIPLEGPSVMW